jgi:hypothetical protein
MGKTMRFIVEHQAQFALDIQQLRETQATTSGGFVTVLDMIRRLSEAQGETNANVAKLTEAQTNTNLRLVELADRVNVPINVVERYFRGNGRPQPSA